MYGLGNIGQSAAVFLGPVVAAAYGFRIVYWGMSVILLVWAGVFVLFARNAPPAARPKGLSEMLAVLAREPLAWALAAFYFLTFGGFVAFSMSGKELARYLRRARLVSSPSPSVSYTHLSFQGLVQELTTHMMKEERVLFPYIVRMEEAVIQKEPVLPPPFGSVQNPVSMMEREHDSAGNALRAMREVSCGYTAPGDACISYQTLYKALVDFEADLHQHIHLENNILFPRAVAMEKAH